MTAGERFVVYPAVDLRGGRVVRLKQGDPAAQTVFSDDPAETARHWEASGATWLHVVNLDGALGGIASSDDAVVNLRRLAEIRQTVRMHIQFGGGIRSLADAEGALAFGADRIILGTAAQQQPELVQAAIERFGANAIVVALDARDGLVATHGWQQTSAVTAVDAATRMSELGVRRILFTDVGRDGMLSGANVAATAALAEQSGLGVIASGGVAGLSDVIALARCAPSGIEGVIVGQALYTGALHLEEAIEAVRLLYGSGIGQAETGEA